MVYDLSLPFAGVPHGLWCTTSPFRLLEYHMVYGIRPLPSVCWCSVFWLEVPPSDTGVKLPSWVKVLIRELFRSYGWAGLSVLISNGPCDSMVETAQHISFSLSIPNTDCYIPNGRTASASQWKASGHKGCGSCRTAWLNTSTFPFSMTVCNITCQFRLYRVAASTFKTDRSDWMTFEQSSSTIRPKLLVYQRLSVSSCETTLCRG